MKNLKVFKTEADYNAFLKSEDYVNPNVSFVRDTNSVKYDGRFGVYIQHIDGKLYTLDEWMAKNHASTDANGVAVVDVRTRFVISKDPSSHKDLGIGDAVEGSYASTFMEAEQDFSGKSNTDALLKFITKDGAVSGCANYTFPNGAKGYLPSFGELVVAGEYITEINEAMNLIDGHILRYSLWSSTLYSDSYMWAYNLDSSRGSYGNIIDTYNYVRPFSAIA